MKIKNKEVIELNNGLIEVAKLSGVKFANGLSRNRTALEEIVKGLADSIKAPEAYIAYKKGAFEIVKEFAAKDKKGQPIVNQIGPGVMSCVPITENIDQANAALAAFDEKSAEIIAARTTQEKGYAELLEQEVEFEPRMIPFSAVPEAITGDQYHKIKAVILDED